MKRTPSVHLPTMRKHGLVIDDLTDEVLIYDLDRHEAHCLNRSAALVWRSCDGARPPAEIARRLTAELDAPFSEDLVLLALSQLEKFHLLEQAETAPAHFPGLSRRQMVRRLGFAAAVAVPVITSIVAPTAVQAATCIQPGQPCNVNVLCCSILGCNPSGQCNP